MCCACGGGYTAPEAPAPEANTTSGSCTNTNTAFYDWNEYCEDYEMNQSSCENGFGSLTYA